MSATAVPQEVGVPTRECHSYKAAPIRDEVIADLVLIFDRQPPEFKSGQSFTEHQQRYVVDADLVEWELFHHLPGALYDQILRAMLARKASLLKVTHAST